MSSPFATLAIATIGCGCTVVTGDLGRHGQRGGTTADASVGLTEATEVAGAGTESDGATQSSSTDQPDQTTDSSGVGSSDTTSTGLPTDDGTSTGGSPCCSSAAPKPECTNAVECCANGQWGCAGTCEGQGELCPAEACCDWDAMPMCFSGARCCDDGSWECGESQCTIGAVCPASCGAWGEDCNGQACCGTLQCCQGSPFPPGESECLSVCPVSDRNQKEHFEAIDPDAVLASVIELPLATKRVEAGERTPLHLGPSPQAFRAAFAVGASDRSIFSVDVDGVIFASVAALTGRVETLRAHNRELQLGVERLERRLAAYRRTKRPRGAVNHSDRVDDPRGLER